MSFQIERERLKAQIELIDDILYRAEWPPQGRSQFITWVDAEIELKGWKKRFERHSRRLMGSSGWRVARRELREERNHEGQQVHRL